MPSFVVQFGTKDGETSSSSFLSQDGFSCPEPFVLPWEAESCLFKFYEELCQDFDEDSSEHVHCFW